MGLISDPKNREKLLKNIEKYNNLLAALSYIAGLAYLVALGHPDFSAKIYLSENALLPGVVDSQFESDFGATKYFQSLKTELKKLEPSTDKSQEPLRQLSVSVLPEVWLMKHFQDLGLETYVQNYSYEYPLNINKDKILTGQNFYSIVRAPRAASTEALVISVPYRNASETGPNTVGGVALLLALASAFKRHNYWAKDIIFLVTTNEEIGLQAWLDAYHYVPHQYILAQDLQGRSGAIQAAINLEIPSADVDHLDLSLEGLNGQLPNLDLFTTTQRLCNKEGIMCTIQNTMDYWNPGSWQGVQHSLQVLLGMILKQASNSPSGNHGLFLAYNIESLTIHGVEGKPNKGIGFLRIGRVLEGIMRSLNNLLERFHQSFFFYLLPASKSYISIGLYMPLFGLLALPIVIKSLALWIQYHTVPEDEQRETADNQGETDKKTKQDKVTVVVPGLAALVPSLILAAVFGASAYGLPGFFIQTGNAMHLHPAEGLGIGLLALFVSILLFPITVYRKSESSGSMAPPFVLLKSVSLLGLGLVLGATALLNISLALIITVVWTPVLTAISCPQYRLVRWLQRVVLVMISPLSLIYILFLISELHRGAGVGEGCLSAWTATQAALLTTAVQGYLNSNWLYPLVTLLYLPLWITFWILSWINPPQVTAAGLSKPQLVKRG